MTSAWLLPEPWSMLITGGDWSRARVELGSEVDVTGTGTPSLVLDTAAREVCIGPRREPLPHAGPAFDLGGGPMRAFALPSSTQHVGGTDASLSSVEQVRFRVGDQREQFRLRQTECIGRPSQAEPDSKGGMGAELQDFIDWQVGCFQELLDTDFAASSLDEEAASVVRRDWGAGRASWLRAGIDQTDPARMSLIVRLSRNKELERTLIALCRSPRRVLERYRDKEKLARVEQLDAACLRWYARQPGCTPPEKAGPRQELVAVRRRESFNTLENRVLKWVLEEARALAIRYIFENRRHKKQSLRCRDVAGFGRRLEQLARSEPINSVSSRLPHPVQPNYQLQQSPAYRVVWSTYQLLLAERRVQDDAWRWQRILWKETCQQVFSACLTAPDSRTPPIWSASTAYYRGESSEGRWTEAPTAPGPFRAPDGGTLHLVDPREGELPPGWCSWLGALGGDVALLAADPSGRRRRGCVVWFHQDWSTAVDLSNMVGRCSHALDQAMRQAEIAGHRTVALDGLLLVNGRVGKRSVELEQQDVRADSQVVAMRLPPDLHEHTPDVQVGIDLLLEQLVA